MKFKLSVADLLAVPVSFKVADGAKTTTFSFTLTMERQTDEQWNTGVKGDADGATHERIKAHLLEITKGWKDQKFVLDEDGQPAEFCAEAMNLMLSSVGVADAILNAFMKENSAKVKNS
jgi:hypothetical protein